METSLGRGYSIHEEFGITDFYSPPSSLIDEADEQDDDLFYPEDEVQDGHLSIVPTQHTTLPTSLIEEINAMNLNALKSPSFKLIATGTTPPPTPLISYRPFIPSNSTTASFQTMTMNTHLPISPSRSTDANRTNWSLGTSTTEIRNSSALFSRPMDNTPKTTTAPNTSLLTPTSIDRYLAEHRRLSDSSSRSSTTLDLPLTMVPPPCLSANRHPSISGPNVELNNEISRLYSYMNPVDEMTSPIRTPCAASTNSWSNLDEPFALPVHPRMNNNNSYVPQVNFKPPWLSRVNSFLPNPNPPISQTPHFHHHHQQQQQQQQQQPPSPSMMNPFQTQNTWLLSEMSAMLRQNQQQQPMVTFNSNITLSTTAQQILASNANNNNNNNRPLRSEKIDIEVIKHLIREAKWKRQCGMKKEVCVFCRNNGENELIYSSHSLKDSMGNVTCPILRAYQCPICGATGAQAHTIKYCQATGDDNNQHIPTPYEKMIRTQCMQTFGLDESMTSTIPTLFDPLASPSSLYTNGWSNSYL